MIPWRTRQSIMHETFEIKNKLSVDLASLLFVSDRHDTSTQVGPSNGT